MTGCSHFGNLTSRHVGVYLQLVIEPVVGKLMKLILVGVQTSCQNMLSLVKTRCILWKVTELGGSVFANGCAKSLLWIAFAV